MAIMGIVVNKGKIKIWRILKLYYILKTHNNNNNKSNSKSNSNNKNKLLQLKQQR